VLAAKGNHVRLGTAAPDRLFMAKRCGHTLLGRPIAEKACTRVGSRGGTGTVHMDSPWCKLGVSKAARGCLASQRPTASVQLSCAVLRVGSLSP
jgi:hypothetical protein